ncbi:hypothetical protein A2U01_0004192 [Trifolium medium]|uniref:Uncharacterized protein n=1 Tax=Trifolium medium TaxID=97028 RepID=A0A392M887_9FABA|nr:hypothetical protein [Trifolium medium]
MKWLSLKTVAGEKLTCGFGSCVWDQLARKAAAQISACGGGWRWETHRRAHQNIPQQLAFVVACGCGYVCSGGCRREMHRRAQQTIPQQLVVLVTCGCGYTCSGGW